VDGLLSKFDDSDFLSLLGKCSYICLCETFVEFVNFSHLLPDFVCHVLPARKLSKHGRRSGGIVCLLHKNVERFFTRVECHYDNIIVFRVCKSLFDTERDILLFNVYVPPQNSPVYDAVDYQNGIDNLGQCISEMLEVHGECALCLCGDFNARTGNNNTNIKNDLYDMMVDVTDETRFSYDMTVNEFGRLLISLCISLKLTILNGYVEKQLSGKFTYISSCGSSVIDYFIVSEDILPLCISYEICETILSPHMCLRLSIQCANRTNNMDIVRPHVTQNKIVWDNDFSAVYVQNLSDLLAEADVGDDVSREQYDIDEITNKITECLVSAADFLKITFWNSIPSERKGRWFDKECYIKKKLVKSHLRRYIHILSNEDKFCYVKSRKDYKQLIRNKKNDYRNNATATLLNNVRNAEIFWKQLNTLEFRTRPLNGIRPDVWVQHFTRIFEVSNSLHSDRSLSEMNCESDLLNSEITQSEIVDAISHLKGGKAPGPDNILSEMLKCSSRQILPVLFRLFNAIFQKRKFPKLWANSIIIPLHKKGSFHDPDNYRGISLTSVLSKVFLHIINKRLQIWADDNNQIGEEQAGFRKHYSTIDNVFSLHAMVQKYLARHKKLYAVFVDFHKAFDTVNRRVLWEVLRNNGIGGRMLSMLKSVYRTVRCCVRCDGELSDYFDCLNGLKQGCKLSPLLFSYLMSSLASEIRNKGKHGIQLLANDTDIFLLLFADDIVLVSDTVIGLQNQISNLKKGADKLGLTVNIQKTKVMVFRLGGHLAKHEKWFLGCQQLEVVSEYRYLGVALSTKLSTYSIIYNLAGRAKAAVYRVMRSLRKLVHVTPEVVFKIFDCQIQPMLLYGSEVWGMDDCQAIETVHLAMLKQFLNVSSRAPNIMVYGDTGRFPLYINATLRSIKYWLKVLKMEEHRFPFKAYQMLKGIKKGHTWASKIRDVLTEHGFENVWNEQGASNEIDFLKSLRQQLINSFNSKWKDDLRRSNRCSLYGSMKSFPQVEMYLYSLDKKVFRDVWIRFRMGLSDMYMHRYRYRPEVNTTLCPSCRESDEDERHLLLCCPAFESLRVKYLIPFLNQGTEDPLTYFLSSKESSVIRAVSTYLYHAFKWRSDVEINSDSDTQV